MLGHVRRLFDIPAPSQTIQPWQFGHPETKATCLWLKSLPRLTPTAHRRGPGGAGASRAAGAGALAQPEPDLSGHRRGDGGAMGCGMTTNDEGAPACKQSRAMSLVEAVANVVVGYVLAIATQIAVFPSFGRSRRPASDGI